MNKNKFTNKYKEIILVIVAHTDDETIGMGGTIAKHVEDDDLVYVISMTNGIDSREDNKDKAIKNRLSASIEAGNILGLSWLKEESFPDNAMDSIPLLSVVKVIEKAKFALNPTLIYTHSSADINIDHRLVNQATLTAFRPQPNESWKEIRTFEVASSTEYGHKSVTDTFYPNLYININKTWKKKLLALKKYKLEMRNYPHSRSFKAIENLAKYRGNQVGLDYAEAFEVIRKIVR